MKKKIVYSFRGEEGLIPEGVNTSKYLQTCVNAYISHSLFDEAVDQWNYVFKGLQVPKGIEVADYIRHAVKTFQQDYHLVMEDGKPVFYKEKLPISPVKTEENKEVATEPAPPKENTYKGWGRIGRSRKRYGSKDEQHD